MAIKNNYVPGNHVKQFSMSSLCEAPPSKHTIPKLFFSDFPLSSSWTYPPVPSHSAAHLTDKYFRMCMENMTLPYQFEEILTKAKHFQDLNTCSSISCAILFSS